jgi:hypothetical protein
MALRESAKKDEDGLAALLIDDCKKRVQLTPPLTLDHNIPGLSLQPMRVTVQNTINEHKLIVSKKRLTHDSTLSPTPSESKCNI